MKLCGVLFPIWVGPMKDGLLLDARGMNIGVDVLVRRRPPSKETPPSSESCTSSFYWLPHEVGSCEAGTSALTAQGEHSTQHALADALFKTRTVQHLGPQPVDVQRVGCMCKALPIDSPASVGFTNKRLNCPIPSSPTLLNSALGALPPGWPPGTEPTRVESTHEKSPVPDEAKPPAATTAKPPAATTAKPPAPAKAQSNAPAKAKPPAPATPFTRPLSTLKPSTPLLKAMTVIAPPRSSVDTAAYRPTPAPGRPSLRRVKDRFFCITGAHQIRGRVKAWEPPLVGCGIRPVRS
jgi:hypothetical protein